MAHPYEQERYRNDPTDSYPRSGVRPHEFAREDDTGFGSLAAVAVLLTLFALVILASAFFGGGTVSSGPEAPVAGEIAPTPPDN